LYHETVLHATNLIRIIAAMIQIMRQTVSTRLNSMKQGVGAFTGCGRITILYSGMIFD